MGTNKPDECIFCGLELEEWEYEDYTNNGERASELYDEDLDICKGCAIKLKKILDKIIIQKKE